MTDTHSRSGIRRRSLTALPLLLVPLLMTACSSPGGSPTAAGAGASGTSTASASTSASTAAAGADLFAKYTTSAQFCALVPLSAVSAAMQAKPAYPKVQPDTGGPVECTYSGGSSSSIVSVAWSPQGDGLLDNALEISPKEKPTTIDVGGHPGRLLDQDVQVVVGDAAIDVFGLKTVDVKDEAALAAAFAQKVG